jgi:hypothetical protein
VLSNPSFQSLQMELIPWQGMKMTLWLWAFWIVATKTNTSKNILAHD